MRLECGPRHTVATSSIVHDHALRVGRRTAHVTSAQLRHVERGVAFELRGRCDGIVKRGRLGVVRVDLIETLSALVNSTSSSNLVTSIGGHLLQLLHPELPENLETTSAEDTRSPLPDICFDRKQKISPEVFDYFCETEDEKAAAVRILKCIQQAAQPDYLTQHPIYSPPCIKELKTCAEIDFLNLEAALQKTPVDETAVPDSIQAIFELSNKTRKKPKKPKAETEGGSKQNSSGVKLAEFIAEVGWDKPAFRCLFS